MLDEYTATKIEATKNTRENNCILFFLNILSSLFISINSKYYLNWSLIYIHFYIHLIANIFFPNELNIVQYFRCHYALNMDEQAK